MIFQYLLYVIAAISLYLVQKLLIDPGLTLYKLQKQYGQKVGIYFFPLAGHMYFFYQSMKENKNPIHFINQHLRKYPETQLLAFNFLDRVFCVFFDVECIKEILIFQFDKIEKIPRGFGMEKFSNQGLIWVRGEQWKKQRRFLSTTFHYESLKSMVPSINRICDAEIEQLKLSLQLNDSPNLLDLMQTITSSVILESFFGQDLNDIRINGTSAAHELGNLVGDLFEIDFQDIYLKLKTLCFGSVLAHKILNSSQEKALLKRIDDFQALITDIILKRIDKKLKNSTADKEDILNLYLTEYIKEGNQGQKQIDLEQIIHQFVIFFFAGMDTTAHLTMMCIFNLSHNQNYVERIRNEVRQEILGNPNNAGQSLNECITVDSLKQLDFTTAIIKQTLRTYPMAPFVFPRGAQEDIKVKEFDIPKGTVLTGCIYHLQQNETHFQDAESFNPDRWLNGFIQAPFSFLPFSAGPRNCIGQHLAMIEAKIILVKFVMNYDLEACYPQENIQLIIHFLNQPKDDKMVRFSPIKILSK